VHQRERCNVSQIRTAFVELETDAVGTGVGGVLAAPPARSGTTGNARGGAWRRRQAVRHRGEILAVQARTSAGVSAPITAAPDTPVVPWLATRVVP